MDKPKMASLRFLNSIFLICPGCREDAVVVKFTNKYFIVKCPCTRWKIDFKIKEE